MKIFRPLLKLSLIALLVVVAVNPKARAKVMAKINELGNEIK